MSSHSNISMSNHSNISMSNPSNISSVSALDYTIPSQPFAEYDDTSSAQYLSADDLRLLDTCNKVTVALNVIITLLVVLSNGAVVYVVARYRRRRPGLRTTTNMFITSLACADLTLGLVIPYLLYITWPDTEHWMLLYQEDACTALVFAFSLPMNSSVYNLLAISCERYLAVCHPAVHDKYMRRGLAVGMIVAVWAYSVINSSLAVAYLEWDAGYGCVYEHIMHGHFLVGNSTSLILVIAITCLLYLLIYHTVRARDSVYCSGNHPSDTTANKSDSSSPQQQKIRAEKRLTKMLVLVLAAFIVTWLPNLIFTLLSESGHIPEKIYVTIIRMFLSVLAHLNSTMNPFIYAWMNKSFRSAFKSLLFGRGHGDQSNSGLAGDTNAPISTVMSAM